MDEMSLNKFRIVSFVLISIVTYFFDRYHGLCILVNNMININFIFIKKWRNQYPGTDFTQ